MDYRSCYKLRLLLNDYRVDNRRCNLWFNRNLYNRLIVAFASVLIQIQMVPKIFGKHLFQIFGNALNAVFMRIN